MRIINPFAEPTSLQRGKMIVNDAMVDALEIIRRNEGEQLSSHLRISGNGLGNRLIEIYYQTSNINSRELITEFMTQAGVVWLRKLLTKDTGVIASSESPLASMDDYLGLLAANDCSAKLFANYA